MRVKNLLCATFFSALLAVSCSTNTTKTVKQPVKNTTTISANQNWYLVNSSDDVIKGLFNKQVTLNIDESNSSITGFSGCNNYNGTITKSKDTVSFKNISSTRMGCPNLKAEYAFISMLEKANRYKIEGNELHLYKDNILLLTFKTT